MEGSPRSETPRQQRISAIIAALAKRVEATQDTRLAHALQFCLTLSDLIIDGEVVTVSSTTEPKNPEALVLRIVHHETRTDDDIFPIDRATAAHVPLGDFFEDVPKASGTPPVQDLFITGNLVLTTGGGFVDSYAPYRFSDGQ